MGVVVLPLALCGVPAWGRRGPRLRPEAEAVLRRFAGVIGYRYAPETVRIYVATVRRWLQFGGHAGHIDHGLMVSYLARRREAVSDASVNMDIKGLRLFYRVQADLGDAAAEELAKIPKQRRTVARLPRVLSDEAVAQLLGSLRVDTFDGLRDYVMIRLLLETGLRSGEVAMMEVPDLLSDGTLYVHPLGSRGRERYVPLTPEMVGLLEGYLHARAQRGAGRMRAFWVSVYNKPLRGGRAIWDAVSARMWTALHRRAGVADLQRIAKTGPWRGHFPHELRATCAARWLANGMPILAVAKLMGHADVSTTARYLGVDLEILRDAVAVHPRARRVVDGD